MAMVNFRSDPETDAALELLTQDGTDKSEAIRGALKAEARRRRMDRVRAESLALRDDPEDRAEMRQVLADMEAVRAQG